MGRGRPRPRGDVLFTSCDSSYFHSHATTLIASASAARNDVHVHVVNPDENVFLRMRDVVEQETNITVSFSYEETDLEPAVDRSTYYACNRFLVAEQILDEVDRLLVIDTDCLLMRNFEFPVSKDLGLFTRESAPGTNGWVHLGTKVAAGIVFLTQDRLMGALFHRGSYHHQKYPENLSCD